MTVPQSFGPSPPAVASPGGAQRPVVLVGFQEQAHLGLGYLASVLRQHGHRVLLLDIERPPSELLAAAAREDPLLVGFSLVFQFYVRRFSTLARYLRDHGIDCHFTVGGHFPTLSPDATFEEVPDLDSIVRFEGEATIVELADCLHEGRSWHDVRGIAWRDGPRVVANAPRPLIEDLDSLPHPDRPAALKTVLGRRMAPLLASRGCARACAFCSIHSFYRGAPGKIVRTRKPLEVVREMRRLYEDRGATIFLFLDDDFPLFGPWRRWAHEFLDELERQQLAGRVIWKISARADSVDADLFSALRDAGLHVVYMGLESGSASGLRTLNKQLTVEQNLRAVEVLRHLDIPFQFGFMMFEPSTTFETVRANVEFLRRVCSGGTVAAGFCRMLPFAGTPIRTELEREGRLRGDTADPDYDFTDARIARLHTQVNALVEGANWLFGSRPLVPELNWAWYEAAVMDRLCGGLTGVGDYRRRLADLTTASNDLLLQVVEDCAGACVDGSEAPWSVEQLRPRCSDIAEQMLALRDGFVARNQDAILGALV
jgi:anaerobic magnesium-protoporphyrin IX monomethyl ester cyclase